ncbi:hypothetical protein FSOLCH5_010814 [Fusarium solani]
MESTAPQGRNRKRKALACEPCRHRKVRCDRTHPCSNCRRSKSDEVCRYVTGQPIDPETNTGQPVTVTETVNSIDASDATASTPGVWQSSEFGSIFVLNSLPTPGRSTGDIVQSVESRTEGATQEAHLHTRPSTPGHSSWILSLHKSAVPIRGIVSKNRYIGQSHWMNASALIPFSVHFLDAEFRNRSTCWDIIQECKTLARVIKAQRMPNSTVLHGEPTSSLPAKHLADQLVDAYLRTFEAIYRILHVPSFKKRYERIWLDGPNAAGPAYLTQLGLCMAIGACFQDDSFSLRAQCTQWIYNALAWLTPAAEKSNMTLFGLQMMCLLHLARLATGLCDEVVWISTGSLLHTAVCMGLHVDPTKLPKMSTLEKEMRRRLWTTILELVLQSSLEAGAPPMIALDEFSCRLPSNYNDDQLEDVEHTSPLPVDVYTDASLQIALAQSFNLRLKIARVANGIGDNLDHKDTSRLSSDLAAAHLVLQTCLSRADGASLFQKRFCEMVLLRYFLVLHLPFASLDVSHPPCSLSRRICIDTALQVSYFALNHSSPAVQESPLSSLFTTAKVPGQCHDYVRLLLCGSGPVHSMHVQCLMITASALSEETPNPSAPAGTGGIARDLELQMLLRYGVEWTERRIYAGQTNVKDHLFAVIMLAHTEAPASAVARDVFMQERSVSALRSCERILRELAGPDMSASGIETEAEHGGFGGVDGFLMNELSDIHWDISMDSWLVNLP